ncbi:MAG: biotin--[acetyl-CoA-carboxylase] ligase, partial [Bradyrhizobium sp.]|nr:biotin--[acetyl-CoA-carboxylase] ligase [Bradyrhizobium sp.]
MPFALGARAAARGYGLVVFDQAGSTNIEALASARQGARAPCWFVTTEQTA